MNRLKVSQLVVRQWYRDPFSGERVRVVRISPGRTHAVAEYFSAAQGRYFRMQVQDGDLEPWPLIVPGR